MKSLLRTRTLRGFPLNVPFTDVEELLTKVSDSDSDSDSGSVVYVWCKSVYIWMHRCV